MQIHTLTVVQRDETIPRVFDMLQYFEMILRSVESLWYSLQDKEYYVGGGTTGGLCRHQQWSPSWILPRIEIRLKLREMVIFGAWGEK